ncbi:Nuclear envelope integral membrane protein [Caenorhabditis elegans]|uniref:Nuclear envelope integral membrane protein n=1 Tax=Caenorhabditis elegans TaxID=6239 RepID=NEMP_CAEEL|nr:Nuclear envelope integral membrane protein [Caenorhabditis elegans]CCD69152.1 Nuclear envelope integral membrane protein [Caenorhabditis elegans]|eukprot:NP_497202.2 Nuclear Envelope integral Membrane Protein homolog [Caenorhabditis elegans]
MRLLTLALLVAGSLAYKFEDCEQKPAALNQVLRVGAKLYSYNLDFFYQKALPYNAIYAFTDVFLQTNLTNADQYQFYQGTNCTTVQQLYDNDNRYFGILRKAALLRSHQLNPFNDTIVGVSTTEPYEISVLIWKVNYFRVGVYVGAIVLFLLASKLVRNVVFYYTSGCSFGLLASLLLVAFIVWRVAPKKTIGVPILIGGWSVSLYMLHFAWSNLQSIMIEYQKYVIGYFATVLLISMAVCYKRGPPTDARSHDIAQWTLQLVALALIYFSVQMVEVSTGTIGALIIQQICRGFLFAGIRWYFVGLKAVWRKFFPARRRLLNEEEYEEQAEKTTKEQLAQLREYCKKEGNRPWKIAGNVRSARRLARFIEGEDDHITEDEIYAHELTGDVLDDEDYDFNEDYGLRTPNESHFDLEDDEDGAEEWDEVVVRRRASEYGRDSVQSVRVPRSVSSRLLSPYQGQNHMNRSLGPGIGFRRDSTPRHGNFQSEHRPRMPRTEQIYRSRRVEYDVKNGRVEGPSSSTASGMTPSEYMRKARRIDATSKTPTRKSRHPTESEDADE